MTPEQAALLVKARESLDAARLLAGKGFMNFAAPRAYYAMFYVAEALLLGEGLAHSKHAAVIAAFGQQFAKTGRIPKEFHRYLIEAEGSRNVGDYDMHASLTAEEVEVHLQRAQSTESLCQNPKSLRWFFLSPFLCGRRPFMQTSAKSSSRCPAASTMNL